MENRAIVKTISNFLIGATLIVPLFSLAYEPQTTHKALTQEIVRFFNYYSSTKISDADRETIMQGSIDEDAGFRALHHFYDPINQRGLTIGNQEFLAAKYWGQDTLAQASADPVFGQRMYGGIFSLFSSTTDYSWDRAIYEYAWGNKERGLKTLGHILHLIEDMAVPDHTRNDAHPPYADKIFHQSSPYEHWADKWNTENLNTADTLIKEKKVPFYCNHLSTCFDSMALYSNQNFFSKDTILRGYELPRIEFAERKREKLSDSQFYNFIFTNGIYLVRYVKVFNSETGKFNEEYVLDDKDALILSSYFSHLSRQAVLHGAGVVKLFFDEVEKEKRTKVLYDKNKSWFAKQWDDVTNRLFHVAGFLYGTSIRPEDLADSESASQADSETTPQPSASASKPPETYSNVLKNIGIENEDTSRPDSPISNSRELENKEKTVDNQAHNPLPQQSIPSPAATSSQTTNPPVLPEQNTVPNTSAQNDTGSSLGAPPGIPSTPDNAYGGSYKGAGGSGDSSSAPSDTTPPDISLSVTECSSSYSSSGCVVSTTTLAISWSSGASDLASYDISCTVDGSSCSGFPLSATSATSTTFSASDTKTYTFTATARDTSGNTASASQTVEVQTLPLVINEVGWGGTPASSNDEWIELYNNSAYPINLSTFVLYSQTDMGPYLSLSGTISAHGYYLIERTADTTISNVTADLVAPFGSGSGMGLSNSGETLVLSYASTTIDTVATGCSPDGWCGGTSGGISLERIDTHVSGSLSTNWGSNDNAVRSGKDSANTLFGSTPKGRNSLNYRVAFSGVISSNTTLSSSRSPYTISGGLTVQSGATLTIQSGVVIKFTDASSLTVNGGLVIQGSSGNQVVITSLSDDDYGGDINGNATSTTPAAGDWDSIIYNPGSSGSISYALVRYGAKQRTGTSLPQALVYIDGVSPSIQQSTFEYGAVYGLKFNNASSTVSGNIIRNITAAGPDTSVGVWSQGGHLTFSNNAVSSNAVGLFVYSGATDSVTSTTFSNNTGNAVRVTAAYPTFSSNTASGNGLNGIGIQGLLSHNHTLSPAGIPYVVESSGLTTSASTTLTISAGTIIKFQDSSSLLTVNGLLNVSGTSGNTVTFTSVKDDAYGGDTNGSTGSPQAGDWGSILVSGTGTSTITYANFFYGGKYNNGFPADYAALKVSNGTVSLSNSTFQNNDYRGLWLSSSNGSTITTSTFSNHTTRSNSSGIYLENATATLGTLTVTSNSIGVDSTGSSVTSLGGHTFSGNTNDMNPDGLVSP